jgi:hypothetical protein
MSAVFSAAKYVFLALRHACCRIFNIATTPPTAPTQKPQTPTRITLASGGEIPVDIICHVLEHLLDDGAYRSAGSLNVTSDTIHDATVHKLYEVQVVQVVMGLEERMRSDT